jgi:hypothetical protein
MIPLFKKVKTQAEKDALIREARATYDAVPNQHRHIFAASDEDYLSRVADHIEVEHPTFTPPRALTSAELAKQDGRLNCMRIFGDRADSDATGIPAIDQMVEKQKRDDLGKLLGPVPRPPSELDGIIEAALAKVLADGRRVPRRESEREPLALAKRTPGAGRIEYDRKLNESTQYASDGGFLRSWIGSPSDGPRAAA